MKRSILFCIALILALMMLPLSASAAGGKEIYKNDFSKGMDESFIVAAGTADILEENGNSFLSLTKDTGLEENGYLNVFFGPEAKDFDLTFKMRTTFISNYEWNWSTISFRSPTLPPTVTESLQLHIWQWRACLTAESVFRDIPMESYLAENVEITSKEGYWYNMKISTRGDRIVAYSNGRLIGDVKSDAFLHAGGFALSSWGTSYDLDDISIVEYPDGKGDEPTPNERPDWMGDEDEEEDEEIVDGGLPPILIGGGGGNNAGETPSGEETPDNQNISTEVDPNEMTVNSYIAMGLIGALLLSSIACVVVVLAVIKMNRDKKE